MYSNGIGSAAKVESSSASAEKNRNDNSSIQNQDSNLKTLLEFKKTLLEEQKNGEKTIEGLNKKIEDTKRQIDEGRILLEDLRVRLKEINEQKDLHLSKFTELKNTLVDARNQMKSLDEKTASAGAKLRKERLSTTHLTRALDQIERDIQTRKLSKDEERKLVLKSKQIATKLHAMKIMYKKEDKYRQISSEYEILKSTMNKIFDGKAELGEKIGRLKTDLDTLLNLRESLYEDRRKNIRGVRESEAKLEMVDTQLNAIEFKKSRVHAAEYRHRRQRSHGRHDDRYEAVQERHKRNKENQERWNLLKEAAVKKMSSGEKLSFEEMKLIFSDDNSQD
jgi:uncharacterized coiled-coil DUF342 family protein